MSQDIQIDATIGASNVIETGEMSRGLGPRHTPGAPPARKNAYLVIDTETTGLQPGVARVWEIVIADLASGEVIWNRRYKTEIPQELSVKLFNGLTTADLDHCPEIAQDLPELGELLSQAEVLIGYNPFFDRNMIEAEFAQRMAPDPETGLLRLQPIKIKWPYLVCAKRVWDQYEPKDRSLQDAYRRFVSRQGFSGAHGALADVQATIAVLQAELRAFDIHDVPWEDMDQERKLWWGPSHHLLMRPDPKNPDPRASVLYVNFGKNNGYRVSMVDRGFWQWLVQRDFDRHVLMLAYEAMRVLACGLAPREADARITAWALEFGAANFL